MQSQGKLSGTLGLSGDWGGCRIRPSPWSFCPPTSLDMTPHSHSLACTSSSLPSDLVPPPEGVKVTAGLQLLNPSCISGAGLSPAGASFSSRPSPSLSGSNLGAQRSSSGAHMRGKWGCPPVRALHPRSASRCSSRRALPRCFLTAAGVPAAALRVVCVNPFSCLVPGKRMFTLLLHLPFSCLCLMAFVVPLFLYDSLLSC